MVGGIETLWPGFLLVSLLAFLWAMNDLLKRKRSLPMKALWAAICFFGGILGTILYAVVVYLPEEVKGRKK